MPSRYDLRSASLPPYRTFGQRADEVAGLLGNLGRGAGYTALDLLGTASDLGLTVTDLLGVTDPAVPRAQMMGTGDWLIDRAADAGLVQPRTGEGAETAGRFLGQVAIPGVSPAEMAGWAKVLPFLLGTFKGMNANLSDDETRMLAKAFELEQQGLGREAIRQATNPPGGSGGWARAPWDQKWRMEVDDSAAGVWGMPAEMAARRGAPLSGTAAQAISVAENRGLRYRDVLQHPELYGAYPVFPKKFARVGPLTEGQLGAMESPFGTLALAENLDPGTARSVGLHELQHGIQSIEGFARGGNPEMFVQQRSQIDATRKLAEIYERGDDLMEYMRGKGIKDIPIGEAWEGSNAQKALTEYAEWQKVSAGDAEEAMLTVLGDLKYPKQIPSTEETARLAMAARKRHDDLIIQSILSPEENYRRLAGEAESRLVQDRRDLTPAQRLAIDPYEQMDTMLKQEGILGGLDDLIVRYGNGPAMSQKMTRKLADEMAGKDPRLDAIRSAMRELDAREQALWDRSPAPEPGSQGLLSGARLDAIEAQERARQAVMGSPDYADIQSSRNALSRRMVKERKKIADEMYRTGRYGAGLLDTGDMTYRAAHRPMQDAGGAARLHDLTAAFPDDVYGKDALQFYGSGDPRERGVLRVLQGLRGKPDAKVTIYRGVPKDAGDAINAGDWVTLDKAVARDYGDKVISMEVPAADVTAWGDSLLEFGYWPK